MYAEFYNLGQDRGVTFPIAGLSVWYGHMLRLCLREEDISEDEESWFFVRQNKDGTVTMCGEDWTDFGVADERFEHFAEVPVSLAKEWLVAQ